MQLEKLLVWLASLSSGSVYAAIGGILLLCGLGFPMPEDISLLAAGYMAHLGVINVHTGLLVCFAAVLGGDTLAFFMGRWFGSRVLEWRFFKRLFTPRKQLRVRAYFRKYGSKVIFVGRFLPGLRFSIFFSAGTMKLRPAVFLIWDGLAALLSVPALVYLAWWFGDSIDAVLSWARRSEYGILALAIAAVVIVALKTVRKRRKSAAADGAKASSSPSPTGT